MPKTKKLPAPQPDSAVNAELAYRKLAFDTASADESERSMPVILMTENPVKVYDARSESVLDEYFDMDGVELRGQIPLVDSHDHKSVRNILGSIRNLRADGRELKGTAYFASKPAAVEAFNDIREGHLRDISGGAKRLEERYVARGQTESWKGKTIKGPARIVTRWQPFEGSAVTVGADRDSQFLGTPALRAYFDPDGAKEDAMTEAFRSLLVDRGMPTDLDDNAALEWAKANTERKAAEPVVPVVARKEEPRGPSEAEISQRAMETERTRCVSIRNAAELGGVDAKFTDDLIKRGLSIDEAQRSILEEVSKRRQPVGIQHERSEHESFRAAVLDGLSMRLGHQLQKAAPGADEFRHTRLSDLAKRCLEFEGISTRSMDDRAIMARAFAINHTTRASDGAGYLTSGSFSNLFLDAQYKRLLPSFENVPSTAQVWARQAESRPDFKDVNVIRLGEVGNQPMVPENGEYQDMSLSDNREKYRVEKHGSLLSFTFEAWKNDDLGGFNRLGQLQMAAMRRTWNKSVYQVLFDNDVLSDTGALFNNTAITTAGGHNNLVATDLTVSNLDAVWKAMMLQTGLNSDVILGITPKYLIVPANLAGTAEQLLGSFANPAVGGSAAGNSGVVNIYGPNGPRRLQLIVEPLIDGNDSNSWYLAADHSQVDTVEYAYLQGEESPVMEQESAFINDAVKYKIRQTWGVKAIDYRGLQKSSGST